MHFSLGGPPAGIPLLARNDVRLHLVALAAHLPLAVARAAPEHLEAGLLRREEAVRDAEGVEGPRRELLRGVRGGPSPGPRAVHEEGGRVQDLLRAPEEGADVPEVVLLRVAHEAVVF